MPKSKYLHGTLRPKAKTYLLAILVSVYELSYEQTTQQFSHKTKIFNK